LNDQWDAVARRAVAGLGVEPGELVLVRDRAGRFDLLQTMLLAVEERGATPLPELVSSDYLLRLMQTTPLAALLTWDRHKLAWMRQVDRLLVLEGTRPELGAAPADALGAAPADALAAWERAAGRLTAVDDERRLPFLLVAAPTETRAQSLGLPLVDLETMLIPALSVDAEVLRAEIARMLGMIGGARALTIRTGADCELRLALGDRRWLDDAGTITPADRARGAHVANLPAGSVYTTVVETETSGRLRLDGEVILRFERGTVVEISGGAPADDLRTLFDRHDANARRVSHIGVGLNPMLHRPIGWTLIDEHVHGALFIAFGENRYLGGANESTLNIDYALAGATLLAGGRAVIIAGTIA
jgi:leucyl aminopeptidase (aminopeptidase T)